jgi:hypothetical protein
VAGPSHFFAVSAQLMRRILVEHARRHNLKRGRGVQHVLLDETVLVSGQSQGQGGQQQNQGEQDRKQQGGDRQNQGGQPGVQGSEGSHQGRSGGQNRPGGQNQNG